MRVEISIPPLGKDGGTCRFDSEIVCLRTLIRYLVSFKSHLKGLIKYIYTNNTTYHQSKLFYRLFSSVFYNILDVTPIKNFLLSLQ